MCGRVRRNIFGCFEEELSVERVLHQFKVLVSCIYVVVSHVNVVVIVDDVIIVEIIVEVVVAVKNVVAEVAGFAGR